MTVPRPNVLSLSSTLLSVLVALNIVFATIFIIILISTWVPSVDWAAALRYHDNPAAMLHAIRWAIMLGIMASAAAHIIFVRLRAIVATVRTGSPFVVKNAERLRSIAWGLLAIQTINLAFGYLSFRTDEQLGWSFGLTGWLAVLLLFVLAKVFEHGAAMNEELEGTV